MDDELSQYLISLERDKCYRVDAVLKDGPAEVTERVYFVGGEGGELGPFIRKRIKGDAGLGGAYRHIFDAQQSGRRFLHLPRIEDCYRVDGDMCVVMELVSGQTLADYVAQKSASVHLACALFPKLCDAVTELHKGFEPPLVHRDLKPSNIMVSAGEPIVIDFGIARTYKEGAQDDTLHFGTRAWAPPEQYGFGQTSVRSDVYALGMLLYFCLTGRAPDAAARERRFRDGDVPEAFRKVVDGAVLLDPQARPSSAAFLKEEFQAAALKAGFAESPEPARLAQPSESAGFAEAPKQFAGQDRQARVRPGAAGSQLGQSADDGCARTPVGEAVARIPSRVGCVWNAVWFAGMALFLLGVVLLVTDPSPSDAVASYPPWRRAVYGASLYLVCLASIYPIVDKRSLRRRFPSYAGLAFTRECIAWLVVLCASMVVFGLVM